MLLMLTRLLISSASVSIVSRVAEGLPCRRQYSLAISVSPLSAP